MQVLHREFMSVINLIPHTLSYCTFGEGYEDDNGDWHEGEETWSDPIPCHAVAAGKANIITYADGSTATYSYTVGRLNPDIREFSVGDRVRVNILGEVQEFDVKGFQRYQLQSKIWV